MGKHEGTQESDNQFELWYQTATKVNVTKMLICGVLALSLHSKGHGPVD